MEASEPKFVNLDLKLTKFWESNLNKKWLFDVNI